MNKTITSITLILLSSVLINAQTSFDNNLVFGSVNGADSSSIEGSVKETTLTTSNKCNGYLVGGNYINGTNEDTSGMVPNVDGKITITVSDSNVYGIVGGNYTYAGKDVGQVSGGIDLTIGDNVTAKRVFAGNLVQVNGNTWTEKNSWYGTDIKVTVDGANTVIDRIDGSTQVNERYLTADNGADSSSYIHVKNGYVKDIRAVNGCGYISGNSTIEVSGGRVDEIQASSSCVIKGDQNIIISGGSVGNIIAGGATRDTVGNLYSSRDSERSNVYITINSTQNVEITGNIVAGGEFNGQENYSTTKISGSTNIKFVGDASNLTFTGTVNGANMDGSGVSGSRNLIFGDETTSFTGTFNGQVTNIDTVSVSAESKVVFANAIDVETLLISTTGVTTFALEPEAQVTLAEGSTFDNLVIDFANAELATDQVINFDMGVVLSGVDTSNVNSLTIKDASGQAFEAIYDASNGGTITVGTAVPEPAEWAAIFGALALGFVIYRKRR